MNAALAEAEKQGLLECGCDCPPQPRWSQIELTPHCSAQGPAQVSWQVAGCLASSGPGSTEAVASSLLCGRNMLWTSQLPTLSGPGYETFIFRIDEEDIQKSS